MGSEVAAFFQLKNFLYISIFLVQDFQFLHSNFSWSALHCFWRQFESQHKHHSHSSLSRQKIQIKRVFRKFLAVAKGRQKVQMNSQYTLCLVVFEESPLSLGPTRRTASSRHFCSLHSIPALIRRIFRLETAEKDILRKESWNNSTWFHCDCIPVLLMIDAGCKHLNNWPRESRLRSGRFSLHRVSAPKQY